MNIPQDLTGRRFGKLKVIELYGQDDKGKLIWKCVCDCGREKYLKTWRVKNNTCHCNRNNPTIIKIGDKYGKLEVISLSENKVNSTHKHYLCRCECGNETVVRDRYLTTGNTTTCGCSQFVCGEKNLRWQGYGEISKSCWNTIRWCAENRNLEFNITIEFIWDLFLKQDRKCALTGRKLDFYKRKTESKKQTASLDRIDSSKGYTEDNVQWIYKPIQKMKWDLDETLFIQLCTEISDYCKNRGENAL